MAENAIPINKEQDKKNSPSPPLPTTPVSQRPTQPPVLMRSRQFRSENVPDYVFRNLFA